jgi:transposase-like protein
MSNTRKTFTTEFKLDAIKLAKNNGNIEETARNLGTGRARDLKSQMRAIYFRHHGLND